MKYLILSLTLIVSSFCYANEKLGPISKIKPGVASQGSLANEKLIADTVEGFKSKLGSEVINDKTEIIKFVIQNPVGNPGDRAWREMWLVDPKGKPSRYIITFSEVGLDAADFKIEVM